MAEPITIYKLTILNMLDKVDFPLTNTQISNFFLEQDYTDYFRVQQVLSDLDDASLSTQNPHTAIHSIPLLLPVRRRLVFSKIRSRLQSNATPLHS